MWRYRRLSEEKKNEIIDKVAEKIAEYELEVPASIFLSGLRPMSLIANQLGILFVGPFLELLGQDSYDVLSLIDKPENTAKLIEKVKAIREEKDKLNDKKPLLERLKSYFRLKRHSSG